MCDILIARSGNRAAMIPRTAKGERWLIDNMTSECLRKRGAEQAVVINEEFANDMAEDLLKEGLSVTIK